MHLETVEAPVLVNALPDFGLAGIILLILACGVLVLAYTRDLRTAISTTLGIAFLAAASGWVFQVTSRRQLAEEHQIARVRETMRAMEEHRSQHGPPAPMRSTDPDSATPAKPPAELLRITLDEESADVAVYQVTGSLAAEGASLVDELVEAACPACHFSLATGDKRIYARKQAEGDKSAQALKGFALTSQSARVTFKETPQDEQLEAVAGIVHKLAAAAKLDVSESDATKWSGTGVARTLLLPSDAVAPAESPIAWDKVLNQSGRRLSDASQKKPPAWVALADQSGELVDGAYVKVASSGRFLSVDQCQPSLNEAIAQEVRNYVRMRLGPQAERVINVPQKLIEERIVYGPVAEEDIASTTVEGGGKRLHALLVFDQKVQEDLKSLFREAQVQGRSLLAISLVAAALLVLGTIYGYLKIDTFTDRKYTRRLQAAVLLLMGLAGAGALWAIRAVQVW